MALSVYLDASVLVALFARDDDFNSRAEEFIRAHHPIAVVSDFACVEFASAIARRARMKDLTPAEARTTFRHFDAWRAGVVESVQAIPADLSAAEASLRRLDYGLRTADAIHLAIARRLDLSLATFDAKMAEAGRALGVKLAAA